MVDELPPTRSANGICAEKVMECLLNDGEVSCISWDDNEEQTGIKRYKISRKPWEEFSRKIIKKNNILSRVILIIARCLYFIKRMCLMYMWPVDSIRCARNFYHKADELIRNERITHVIAVSFPGETVLAMKWLKKRYKDKIKTILYPLDVTIEGKATKGIIEKVLSRLGGKRFLRNCGKYADAIMVLENAQDLFYKSFSEQEHGKFIICGIPLLQQTDWSKYQVHPKENDVHIIFGGNLIAGMREPTILLDTLDSLDLPQNRNIVFDLFGQMDKTLKDLWNDRFCNLCIVEHGWVKEETLNEALINADILLSVGNSEKYLIPSKLFKYMTTGKPILHFLSTEKDPCIPYLNCYKNSFMVNKDNLDNTKKELTDFVLSNYVSDVSVVELFPTCTPQYTANKIIEI